MVKSRTLRFTGLSRLSIALENKKAARGGHWSARKRTYQRISELAALVTATGLPALITGVDWAVWL